MTTANRLMTADELFCLPDDDNRRELIRGELRTMAPAGFEHGAVGMRIGILLGAYVRDHNMGILVGPDTGFILFRNPDTVRSPDFSFVSAERIRRLGVPKKFYPGAPDLAVEVLSPDDTVYDLEEKIDELFAAGTKLVWVVNPRNKTVTVHRGGAQSATLREGDQLSGEDVAPGFACAVVELFV